MAVYIVCYEDIKNSNIIINIKTNKNYKKFNAILPYYSKIKKLFAINFFCLSFFHHAYSHQSYSIINYFPNLGIIIENGCLKNIQ